MGTTIEPAPSQTVTASEALGPSAIDIQHNGFAFLFFDADEPVSLGDLALLWGLSIEGAQSICRECAIKGLIQPADIIIDNDDDDENDVEYFFLNESQRDLLISQLKNCETCLLLKGCLLAKLRLGFADHIGDDLAIVELMCDCIDQQRRFLLKKIFERLGSRILQRLCRQSKCPRTSGKSFLHHLYFADWDDDSKIYAFRKHSWRMIAKLVHKFRRDHVDALKCFTESDDAGNCLLSQIFDEYDDTAGNSDLVQLCYLISPWKHIYEEIVWKKEVAIQYRQNNDNFLIAVLNGDKSLAEEFFRKNPENRKIDRKSLAMRIAARLGETRICKMIREETRNIDLSIVMGGDEEGWTPLLLAAANGHVDTVKYLYHEYPEFKRPALSVAAANGHLSTVQFLHSRDQTQVLILDDLNRTALAHAAENGHLDLVALLHHDYPHAVKMKDCYGATPLLLAAKNGHLDVVRFLYRSYPDAVEMADERGELPVSYAVSKGHLKTAKFLFQKFPDAIKKTYSCKLTLLSLAARSDDLEMVEFFYNQYPSAIELVDSVLETPLASAASMGNLEIVKYLCAKAPALLKAVDYFGMIPLISAAKMGHLDVVKFLQRQDPSGAFAADNMGRTALAVAADAGYLSTVKFLYNLNPKAVEMVDKEDGATPLLLAARNGYFDVVKFLYDKYPTAAKLPDKDGTTVAYWAVMSGNFELVKFLVDNDPSVAEITDTGNGGTLLTVAASKGDLAMAKFLHQVNAGQVKLTDHFHRTPLFYAVRSDDFEMAEFLFYEYPSARSIVDNDGQTPMSIASRNGSLRIMNLLNQQLVRNS